MNSFYGDVKNGTRVSLIFDKTYGNRKAMEAAISKLGGTIGNKNGDGIYNTRYVLIDYGEKRYCPYMSIKTVNATWYDPTTLLFNNKGPQLYIYNEQTASYSNVKSTDKYDKSTVYYVRMDGETAALDKSKVALTPDYIDENCEYYKNRKIDENEYNGAYHHTVWQKIWCSVGVNSTITEKYIMVAELDAKAPQFNVIIDAPDDNDVYSLVSKRTSVGKRLPLDTNNLYYKKVNNEFILASDEDVANWNNENIDYNNLTVKELFSSPLFRYSEISSDVYYYKPLETDDVNPTPFIKDQNSLDEYINRLGNIYRSSNYNLGEDKMTYEPVTAGMAYLKSNGIREVKYYYRTFSEDGIISETLFNRFKAADDVLYHKVNGVITAVTNDDIYDKTDKYLQRQPLMNGMGPHVDPIRSTDLDYKLHLPRNWKFNTDSDLDFNNAGFDPRKQSYTPNAKNKIFLKKEKSGAVYPVHMTKEGYMAFGADDETALNSIQIPDAGYYVNNELQYVEQIDQRKFDFVLPEFGNVMSQLWDLVYPRGDWEQVTNPNYDDDNYKNGNYYYKEGDYYYKVMPGDNLESDKIYWIFVPAPGDSTDANRYLFVGNDRAPEDYPKTLAELIRYIYDLLGLETDNDYRDVPSKDTIWGMVNGLIELFGKFTDKFGLDRFIPIRSEYSDIINGSKLEQVQYGPAGLVDYGQIQSESMYNKLNDSAFGPLYIIKDDYPIWEKNTAPFNNQIQYYIKNGDYYTHVEINEFEDNVIYYVPYILYEKSIKYDISLQYYRDMNSLWGLLREFQQVRDKYQANFTENTPGSPAFIKNRPSVIYAKTGNITTTFNNLPLINNNEYRQLLEIKDQATLNTALNNLIDNQWITVYYVDRDDNSYYETVQSGDSYIVNGEYYLIDKTDYDKELHAVEPIWKNVLVTPSDKETYIINNSQVFSIEYYTMEEIMSIFENGISKEELVTKCSKGDIILLSNDDSVLPVRILDIDVNGVAKVMSLSPARSSGTTGFVKTFKFNESNSETNELISLKYSESLIHSYLNETYLNSLSQNIQNAIIPTSIEQNILSYSNGRSGSYKYRYLPTGEITNSLSLNSVINETSSNEKIFILDFVDYVEYFSSQVYGSQLMNLFKDGSELYKNNVWTRSILNQTNQICILNKIDRNLTSASDSNVTGAIYPAFYIDLMKTDFSKQIILPNKGETIAINNEYYRILNVNPASSSVQLLAITPIKDKIFNNNDNIIDSKYPYLNSSIYKDINKLSSLNDIPENSLIDMDDCKDPLYSYETNIDLENWDKTDSDIINEIYNISVSDSEISTPSYNFSLTGLKLKDVNRLMGKPLVKYSLLSLSDINNFYETKKQIYSQAELKLFIQNHLAYDLEHKKYWLQNALSINDGLVINYNGQIESVPLSASNNSLLKLTVDLNNLIYSNLDLPKNGIDFIWNGDEPMDCQVVPSETDGWNICLVGPGNFIPLKDMTVDISYPNSANIISMGYGNPLLEGKNKTLKAKSYYQTNITPTKTGIYSIILKPSSSD